MDVVPGSTKAAEFCVASRHIVEWVAVTVGFSTGVEVGPRPDFFCAGISVEAQGFCGVAINSKKDIGLWERVCGAVLVEAVVGNVGGAIAADSNAD